MLIQRNSNKYAHFEILDYIRENNQILEISVNTPFQLDEFVNITQAD